MNKTKRFILGTAISIISAAAAFSNVSFSAKTAASTGLETEVKSQDDINTGFPINFSGQGQLNFDDWGILRTGLSIKAPDLLKGTIRDGHEATILFDELSFVLNKRATSMTHYFSVYMGSYEPFGSDIFFKRQFGTGDFSSLLLKSSSTLEEVPLLDCNGYGISYISRITRQPIALGFYLYGNDLEPGTPEINLDFRYAMAYSYVTLDIRGGIGAPLLDSINGQKAALVIDTLYAHGGMTLFLGNKYTHSLLLQGGVCDISISETGNSRKFKDDDIFFLVEPRIYTESMKFRLTLFSLNEKKVREMEYLEDTMGAALTVFNDTLPAENSTWTLGLHAIVSLPEKTIANYSKDSADGINKINASVVPYLELPAFGGKMELMFQASARDITDSLTMKYKFKLGYKKIF